MENAVTDARNQVFEGYINEMMLQVEMGRRFTRISPTVLYQCASEVFAGTGVARFWDLYQQIKRYQRILRQYVLDEDRKDPDSLHLLFDQVGWRCISQKPVDFSTVPRFQERDPSIAESLKWAIWDVGLLMLFNVILFMLSYVAFLKYDVR